MNQFWANSRVGILCLPLVLGGCGGDGSTRVSGSVSYGYGYGYYDPWYRHDVIVTPPARPPVRPERPIERPPARPRPLPARPMPRPSGGMRLR